MNHMKEHTLRVTGANLSYTVCGTGPILLLISGGGNDAHSFDTIVKYLIDQYTVVTYSRRGLSQSTLDNPQEEQLVETHSNDAHRLLKELGSEYEPAFVFGSSGGAVIGLDLVTRHPEQLQMLIAHEPPTHLSSKVDPIQEMAAVAETCRRDGILAASQKLMALPGMNLMSQDIAIKLPNWTIEEKQQHIKNMMFLFEHEVAMFDRYQFDFVALKNASIQTRVVIGGGDDQESAGYWSALAVTERLGTHIVEFPGNHIGYITDPEAFSRRLLAVLREISRV